MTLNGSETRPTHPGLAEKSDDDEALGVTVPPHLAAVFGDDVESYQAFRRLQTWLRRRRPYADLEPYPISGPVDWAASAVHSRGRLTDLRHAHGDCTEDCYCCHARGWSS